MNIRFFIAPGIGALYALSTFLIQSFLVPYSYRFLSIAATSYGIWDQYADYFRNPNLIAYISNQAEISEEFDFIVVGAGSAGSVLANRLSINGQFSVLLLESGGNINPLQHVPLYCPYLLNNAYVDYAFYTVPQVNACLALKDQKSLWPRGMGLGGTSNINAMVYQRGNKYDYDRWAELSGSNEWKYENLLKNFKNIEDYHGSFYNELWHSNDGNGVHVSVSNEERLLSEFLEAGREMGYPTKDVNGIQEASFSTNDVTIKNGYRHSAYTAFLEPVLHKHNLKIHRYARVEKVRVNKNNRATGVIFRRHGLEMFAKAKKEVILSAGAIDSPKLLMLSGIGPRIHLEQLGIQTLVDLPVGYNLQDHIMTLLPFSLETKGTSFKIDRDVTMDMFMEYYEKGTGPLSTTGASNSVAYIYGHNNNKSISARKSSPEIQLYMQSTAPVPSLLYDKFGGLKTGFWSSYLRNLEGKDGFIIEVVLAKVKSRGMLQLASSNHMDKPIIDPKYFSHPEDLRNLVAGMNFTVAMVETTNAFKKHGARLLNNPVNGCEHLQFKSLAYYECTARHVTLTVYHASGTCSMGRGINDPKSVVDHQLRVLGIKGLRVVDASVIPEIPNSNINAAVYMLADKASEMILHQWKDTTLPCVGTRGTCPSLS